MRDFFTKFLRYGTPNGQRHFFNAHFPGLYSIVLAADGDLLTRAFIARPGELHPSLQSANAPFLWHSHGYDFTETAWLGWVNNYCIAVGSKRPFFEYEIVAGIDTGRVPVLELTGKRLFDETDRGSYGPGESFSMKHDIIHRVTFHPCAFTGWFACVVQEHKKYESPKSVFCEHQLWEVPDADKLYAQIGDDDATDLIIQLSNCG